MKSPEFKKEDLMDLGEGTAIFANQFKPLNIKRVSAKTLLIDDEDYS